MKRLLFLFVAFTTGTALAAPVVVSEYDLEKRVSRLERMMENPVLLQLSDRLAEQQREIQALQDRVDRLEYRLRQQKADEKRQLDALKARIDELEAQLQRPAPADSAAVEQASAEAPVERNEAGGSEKGLKPADTATQSEYSAAFTLLQKAHYAKAAKAFEAFLKKHPDSVLAPNAAYWAGEAYMVLLDYKSAWNRFEQVIKQYPDSSKVPAALYRGAAALAKLGRKQEAIKLLQREIKAYPDDTVTPKARALLKQLQAGKAK
ncbi:tol-pal system protein YbgF [Sulfurivirga caldicuralii]|uniref:Cell division coordinator CpoB n=1 Tax=Sulfurivirga caldicuralii TaxID=364032 RepID=A0A1N6EQQ2_9GAMM|nr:tol-pal system protein YbgF [Sulfurivirga caldicuralii]SIN85345.1 tol-pal system protein YbgF [Sulfurivirga caldicuralii]